MSKFGTVVGGAVAAWLGAALVAGPALAGPCEAEIAEIAKTMANASGKESGTLSGNAPGGIQNKAPMPETGTTGPTGKEQGTLAGSTPEGQGRAVDPAAGKATSAQDVRLQQQGMPTTAQGGDPRTAEGHLTQAKAALDKARSLDASNDAGCKGAVDEAKQLMRQGT
jgi:hypothetical protein